MAKRSAGSWESYGADAATVGAFHGFLQASPTLSASRRTSPSLPSGPDAPFVPGEPKAPVNPVHQAEDPHRKYL